MNEDNPVIQRLRARVRSLHHEITLAEREWSKFQAAADAYARKVEDLTAEREQSIAAVAVLLDQDTVNIDVPRHVVVDALNKEGGDNDETT